MQAMATLGETIKAARKSRGITSLDLALRIGVTQATISRLENDEYAQAPKPEIVRGLSRELRIPEVDLLSAAGYAVRESASAYDADSAEIARVVARWTPARRRWLLEIMQRTDAMLRDDEPNGNETAGAA